MNKIEKAILAELKEWDLTCSEEPSLKIELAKAIAKVVKNCNIPPVINCKPKTKKVNKIIDAEKFSNMCDIIKRI